MNARQSIENLWDRATPVGPLLDAYRAEVLREADDKGTPSADLTPIPLRWDRLVMQPDGSEDDQTIVCCMTEDGRPAALFLDDEHREALGLQLVDPNPEQ